MHPMILHFPIALLFVGMLMYWVNSRKSSQHQVVHELTQYIFCIYALGSALTAVFGFFLYKDGPYTGGEIFLHKWLGAASSFMAVPILLLTEKTSRLYTYGILGTSAVCITVAGHFGSEITHGKGFLTEPIRRYRQTRISQIENPDSAIVFRDVIQPILNEKCLNCHSASKAKNNLILEDYLSVMEGGNHSPSVVPGKAHESLVFKYVSLPLEDSLHMPPEGKVQLDPEEIKLLGWWINAGASATEKYVTLPKVDSIHPLMVSRFQPKTGLDLEDIPFADQSTIDELNNPYRTVRQIAVTKPYVAVFLGTKKDFSGRDLAELSAIRKQVTAIDLGNSSVADDDLKELTQFVHLQKLHLQNTSIGDESISSLRELRFLESLNLSGTRISTKAIDEISGWKNLRKLYLYNTAVGPESIQNLSSANPDLEVFNTQLDLTDSLYTVQLTVPVSKIDSAFFRGSASVEIKQSRGNVRYYYTLDGSQPTTKSTLYEQPFTVDQSGELRIIAIKEGWIDSNVASSTLVKIGTTAERIILETKADEKLSALKDSVLTDGKAGSLNRGDKAYMAFIDQDFQGVLQLGSVVSLSQVTLSFLEDIGQGVLAPEYLEVWGGESMGEMVRLGGKNVEQPGGSSGATKGLTTLNFPEQSIRFIRIKAKRRGVLPSGYPDDRSVKPSIFVDEVALN
jgi:hypothetical protein